MIRSHRHWAGFAFLFSLVVGCSSEPLATGGSDREKVRSADISILFVGNSHTNMHGLPNLIGEMIRFRHPEKTYYSYFIGVRFLEDLERDPRARQEIESRPWKFVVLQAQKESRTGQFQYSQAVGIEVARLAKSRGVEVVFYAEWGLQSVPGHGPRIEKIYREMATASDARVAPVGRAWDRALSERPDLLLHASDGNHQTPLGAFLTACVLFGKLTEESPAALASFPYPGFSEADRKFLADVAAKTLDQM